MLVLSFLCVSASAEEIAVELSSGRSALANYHKGNPSKPAIFVLHGFLQTSNFSTVQLISEEMADKGYTVLAPTLTLNIDQRRNGLGCDAIQNHNVADSNNEIGDWMSWLRAKGHKQIITIGHSSGSMQLLSYISERHGILPDYFIATAIGPIDDWHNPKQANTQLSAAQHSLQQPPNTLGIYTLAFCYNNYTSPPASYISYRQWDREWILQNLKQSPVPFQIVLGSSDTWLPPDWRNQVIAAGLPLTMVEEATHNFTGPQEFDFLDALVSLIETAPAAK